MPLNTASCHPNPDTVKANAGKSINLTNSADAPGASSGQNPVCANQSVGFSPAHSPNVSFAWHSGSVPKGCRPFSGVQMKVVGVTRGIGTVVDPTACKYADESGWTNRPKIHAANSRGEVSVETGEMGCVVDMVRPPARRSASRRENDALNVSGKCLIKEAAVNPVPTVTQRPTGLMARTDDAGVKGTTALVLVLFKITEEMTRATIANTTTTIKPMAGGLIFGCVVAASDICSSQPS